MKFVENIYRIHSKKDNPQVIIRFISARYKSVAMSKFKENHPNEKIYTNLNQDIEGIKRVSKDYLKRFYNQIIVSNQKRQREIWQAEEESRKNLQLFAVTHPEIIKELDLVGITFNPFHNLVHFFSQSHTL